MRGWMIGMVMAVVLTATSVFAQDLAQDLKGNLSGVWRVTYSEGGKDHQYEFVAMKTPLKLVLRNGQAVPYYSVSGDGIERMKVIGMSIVETEEGRYSIVWSRMASANSGEGTRFDGESNKILKVEGDTWVLGGDFEEFEVARMTRLPYLVP